MPVVRSSFPAPSRSETQPVRVTVVTVNSNPPKANFNFSPASPASASSSSSSPSLSSSPDITSTAPLDHEVPSMQQPFVVSTSAQSIDATSAPTAVALYDQHPESLSSRAHLSTTLSAESTPATSKIITGSALLVGQRPLWDANLSVFQQSISGVFAVIIFVAIFRFVRLLHWRQAIRLPDSEGSPSLSNSSSSSSSSSVTSPTASTFSLAPSITTYARDHSNSSVFPSRKFNKSCIHSHRRTLSPLIDKDELVKYQSLQDFFGHLNINKPGSIAPPPFTPPELDFSETRELPPAPGADFIYQPNPDFLSLKFDNFETPKLTMSSQQSGSSSGPESSQGNTSQGNNGYSQGQIIQGQGSGGQSWSRHTIVYGNGPCPCCSSRGGGSYGPSVSPAEKRH